MRIKSTINIGSFTHYTIETITNTIMVSISEKEKIASIKVGKGSIPGLYKKVNYIEATSIMKILSTYKLVPRVRGKLRKRLFKLLNE